MKFNEWHGWPPITYTLSFTFGAEKEPPTAPAMNVRRVHKITMSMAEYSPHLDNMVHESMHLNAPMYFKSMGVRGVVHAIYEEADGQISIEVVGERDNDPIYCAR